MKYLVQMKANELFPSLPPEALQQTVKHMVFPSLDKLVQWSKEGKATGGICAGQRQGAMIVEAADSKALDDMLLELPFWGMMQTTVTPLVDFGERRASEEALLNQMSK